MKNGLLTGNAIKIIAMLSMLIDHIGVILLDNYAPFRIIGRLAFPLFAYMISEGCLHTGNKFLYFLRIAALGSVCQAVFLITGGSLYLNILLTFSVSILLIYLLNCAKKNAFLTTIFLCAIIGLWYLVKRISAYDVAFDYGFYGIMFPVILAIGNNKREKAVLAFFGLFILAQTMGGHQLWSLLSVIPMLLYNGRRGKKNMKTIFYLFYPLHLVILYGISNFI